METKVTRARQERHEVPEPEKRFKTETGEQAIGRKTSILVLHQKGEPINKEEQKDGPCKK